MKLLDSRAQDTILKSANHILFNAANQDDARMMLNEALNLLSNRQIINIEPTKGAIGIDQIRDKKQLLSLKRRADELLVIAIFEAQLMTREAQNSMLKTLEDSVVGLQVLMSSNHSDNLLPTIRSRMLAISYKPPKIDKLSPKEQNIYKASGYSYSVLKAYKDSDLPQLDTAKRWYTSNKTERAKAIKDIKTKEDAIDLVNSLLVIQYGLLDIQAKSSDKLKTKHLVNSIDLSLAVLKRLMIGGNIKLNITQLALGL